MASELGEYNIRVNTVHPAGVDTDMVTEPDLQSIIASKADTLGAHVHEHPAAGVHET